MDGNESPWARPPQSETPPPAAPPPPPGQRSAAPGWYGPASTPPPTPPSYAPPSPYQQPSQQPSAPHQGSPYQQAPYQQAPYQQAPYQQAPYQQAPYQRAPYQPSAYGPPPYQSPYQSPYQPPVVPAPPRKPIGRHLIGGVVGVVLLGLVGVAGGWAISPYLPVAAASPSVSVAPPSPAPSTGQSTAAPSTSSGTAHPTSGPSVYSDQTALVASPLYALETAPLECAGLKLPIPSGKALEPWAKKAVSCLHDHYEPIVEKAGFELTVPTITFFDDSIDTPCGEGSGAFYCGSNEGIYVERGVYDTDARDRLNTIRMLLHEFSHHVQQRVGILDAGVGAEREDYPVVSRRIELQVSCWTGMQLRDSKWLKWTDDDEAWLKEISSSSSDKLHGSARSRRYWYDQSVGESTFGACNTWVVDASKVD